MSIAAHIDLLPHEVLDIMDRTEKITIILPIHDPRIENGSVVKHKQNKYKVNNIVHGKRRVGLEVTQLHE